MISISDRTDLHGGQERLGGARQQEESKGPGDHFSCKRRCACAIVLVYPMGSEYGGHGMTKRVDARLMLSLGFHARTRAPINPPLDSAPPIPVGSIPAIDRPTDRVGGWLGRSVEWGFQCWADRCFRAAHLPLPRVIVSSLSALPPIEIDLRKPPPQAHY